MGPFNDTSVLVTGGAGFIGSHLVDALAGQGARVRVLDNLATGKRRNLARSAAQIELIEGDIRSPEFCHRACEGVRFVFHQAALGSVPRSLEDPGSTVAANIHGTTNIFAAARDSGVERVVYASSSSVYGDSRELPKKEGHEGRLLSPYALSKKVNEELADVFARCYAMQLIGLRYFNIFGPRQEPEGPYAAVIPRFFAAFLEDRTPVIYGDGEQSRDFTFVTDAVRANLLAATASERACGQAFNIAGGRRATVNELATRIRGAVGRGQEPRHEPSRAGDVRHSLADTTKARELLGFEAEITLEEGLEQTYPAYLEQTGEARGTGEEANA